MEKKLLNIKELCEYIGITVSTGYSWVSQRRIPFVKCGRLTKFDKQRIDRWIEDNTIVESDVSVKRVCPRRFPKI